MGTSVGQLLVLLAAPLLTRIYSTEAFGDYSVYFSLLSIISIVGAAKYELAIPVAKDDRTAGALFQLSFLILCFLVLLFCLINFIFGDAIFSFLNIGSSPLFRWLLIIGFSGQGLFLIFNYSCVRLELFQSIASGKIVKGATHSLVQIGSGLTGFLSGGLIIGDVAGRFLGLLTMLRKVFTTNKDFVRRRPTGELWQAARQYHRFPQYLVLASVCNTVSLNILPIYANWEFGSHITGLVGLGQRLIAIPIVLITGSISQVYYQRANTIHRDGGSLRALFTGTISNLLKYSFLPMLLLLFLGPPLFGFVFGGEWRQSGEYVQILGIYYFLQLLINPLSQTLNILGRQHWQLGWDVTRLLSIAVGLTVCSLLDLNIKSTLIVYTGIMAATYILLFFMLRVAISGSTQGKRING